MQGKPEVIDALNGALTIELTAINQYFCQGKMCHNWGFKILGETHVQESMGEMKHAEKLIDRILFLDEDNSRLGPLAQAVARQGYPLSGEYDTAGRGAAAVFC